MNNSRFVASFYFPATDYVFLPTAATASSIANMPVAYQVAAVQQQEVLQLSQQEAYLKARQPAPVPIEAAPIHEEVAPVYEAAPEPYVEPVYSSYAADNSSVPLYYRMASYSAPLTKATPTVPPSTMKMDVPLEAIQQKLNEIKLTEPTMVVKPIETTVPLDYFMQNTHLQHEVHQVQRAEVAPVPAAARVSASVANGFQKMQFANGEEASAYLFESSEDKIFTENYNTLDNVPEMSPRKDVSEAIVPSFAGSVQQAALVAPASHPQTGFNQRLLATGGYNNEESCYLSFQNDEIPAYGQNIVTARYNYESPPAYTLVAPTLATVTQEPANQSMEPGSLSVSTASVEKSRYNAAIRESEEAVEQEPIQEKQMDLRLIGNAFRSPVLNAASEYQSEHLNELVSMIN